MLEWEATSLWWDTIISSKENTASNINYKQQKIQKRQQQSLTVDNTVANRDELMTSGIINIRVLCFYIFHRFIIWITVS